MGKLILLGIVIGAAVIFSLLEAMDVNDDVSAFVSGAIVIGLVAYFIPKNALIAVGFTVLGIGLAFGLGLLIKRLN